MTPAAPRILPGDCRETMATLADLGEIFDACVTDPPYDLTSIVRRFGSPTAAPAKPGTDGAFVRASRGFMGKTWDGTGVAFDAATWRAVYDVLKPGAHLIAFGGTRTFHRMACAIEDAGFEIRDTIMWVYGTGFPKSHDVSKAIDKGAGAERAPTGSGQTGATWGAGAEDGFEGAFGYSTKFERRDEPATPEAAAWRGWGTALKPAVEPIILARKPFKGALAANVLANGTGALNIDACRVHGPDAPGGDYNVRRRKSGLELAADGGSWNRDDGARYVGHQQPGRWPANLVHDGSDEVIAAFPAAPGQIAPHRQDGAPKNNAIYGAMRRPLGGGSGLPQSDSGSAARFFYSAKAAKADRAGSKHPTVKPLALMRWLCTLVTPPGGRILDPFAGSGSTLQAAYECGFDATGCEREPEYLDDIRERLRRLICANNVSEKDTHVSDGVSDGVSDIAATDMADFLA